MVFSYLLPLTSCLLIFSCNGQQDSDIDDMLSSDEHKETAGDALNITELNFSDNKKEMKLSVQLMHDIGGYDLMDSTRVELRRLQQVQLLPGKYGNEIQPEITKIENPSRDVLKNLDMKLLLLVDLSLPQHEIDEERNAVKEIRALFGQEGVYISFMQGDNISETYEATDYITSNYFVHKDPSYVYLYRSILTKLAELTDTSTTVGRARYKAMVIMSGGKTYQDDMPVDPKHFALQQLLADKTPQLKGSLLAYYANFSPSMTNGEELFAISDNSSDTNILQYFCKDLEGIYQTSFNWQEMEADMLKEFHIDLSYFYITMENPDGKLFRGSLHKLQIGFYDKENNDLVAKGETEFAIGSTYNPIIVNDVTMTEVIISGALVTMLILFFVWMTLQFIEPYIRYRVFKHKYVIKYSGNKMSVEGLAVAESCYLCKGTFETDDEIVVKCQHTMHKECWDANEYHCPEHGRHCKEGSHYYNWHNPFDTGNALFYMKWVLVAIIVGFLAWCLFINQDHSSMDIIGYMHDKYHELTSTTDVKHKLQFVYSSYLSDLPGFGQTVGFLLTFFLSAFTVSRRRWLHRLAEMLMRAVVASIVGCLCCLLGCLISVVLHLTSATFLIDWIPWVLLSCVIMLAVTIRTRTPIRRSLLFASGGIAVLSVLMWGFVYFNTVMDYRTSLLVSFIVYTVAIAICIAKATPKSERYFLHVEGAIKEMDIALYKWIRADVGHAITIGKSVDCDLQLSWDINGDVAPVQAEIKRHMGSLRLTALEDGVTVKDKALKPGREIWLYHGRKFTIGNTTFTYIEKDL